MSGKKTVKKKSSGRPPMVAKAGVKRGTKYACGGKKRSKK